MKIIISPSKTQNIRQVESIPVEACRFKKETARLVKWIQAQDKSLIERKMKIKDQLLEDTMNHYNNFGSSHVGHAVMSYTGTVFKEIQVLDYDSENIKYMNRHLCILSALYGVLEPFNGINEYRLDMKMGIYKTSLYGYWKNAMEGYFKGETIISLASGEYEKMIPKTISHNMISIDFQDQKNGQYKSVGYYSKVARGKMLNIMILKQIEDLDKLKTITFDGYSFNQEKSTDRQWYFTRSSV